MQNDLTLEDLVSLSGLPLRTVRFYIQEGLLPGPDTRGKYAAYSREHLDKLLLVQHFKNLHFPLSKIRDVLNSISRDEIEEILRGAGGIAAEKAISANEDIGEGGYRLAGLSAIDYIRNIENVNREVGNRMESRAAPAAPVPGPLHEGQMLMKTATAPLPDEGGKNWRRIEIEDGLELHIRSDREPRKQDAIGRVVKMIREQLK